MTVVVGASSGVGLAVAARCAAGGDDLVLAARDREALTRAEEYLRGHGANRVMTVVTDVRDPSSIERLVGRCLAEFGRVDVLVQTALTMAFGRLEDVPADVFAGVVETTVHGTANLARVFLPVFRRQGRGTFIIVNSLVGAVTVPYMGAYAAAKWGQRAVARTLQQEVRNEPHIHVCIISPGSVNTPVYYQAANYAGHRTRPPFPVLQPARVADVVFAVAHRPRRYVSVAVGPANPLIILAFRTLPWLYDFLVGPLYKATSWRGRRDQTDGNVLAPVPEGERVHGHWPDDS